MLALIFYSGDNGGDKRMFSPPVRRYGGPWCVRRVPDVPAFPSGRNGAVRGSHGLGTLGASGALVVHGSGAVLAGGASGRSGRGWAPPKGSRALAQFPTCVTAPILGPAIFPGRKT